MMLVQCWFGCCVVPVLCWCNAKLVQFLYGADAGMGAGAVLSWCQYCDSVMSVQCWCCCSAELVQVQVGCQCSAMLVWCLCGASAGTLTVWFWCS